MDSAHLESMGRQLNCPICLSLLNSAVSLTCNHVFCNLCIAESMKSLSQCPVCKVPTRPREIRAAPHMDNLVSIYKSMKAAAGTSVFSTHVTPMATNTDESRQDKEKHNIVQETRGQRQRKCKRKLTSKPQPNYHEEKSSKDFNHHTMKPSFPAKKRIHVTPYPISETPVRPSKVSKLGNQDMILARKRQEDPSSESTGNKLNDVNKNISNDDHGEPLLSPFFWLREGDEEDGVEKSSCQQLTESLPSYVTPCFSDIKDTDDETLTKSMPSSKLDATEVFETEMFEWTQRACSPELCSTPERKQTRDKQALSTIQENMFKEGTNFFPPLAQVFGGNAKVSKSCSKKKTNKEKKKLNTKTAGGKRNLSENVLSLNDNEAHNDSEEIVENSIQENEEADERSTTRLGKKSSKRVMRLRKDKQGGCQKILADNAGLNSAAEATGPSSIACANEINKVKDINTGVSNRSKMALKRTNSRSQRKSMTRSSDDVLANMLEVLIGPLGEVHTQSKSDGKGSDSIFTECLGEGKHIVTSVTSELDDTKDAAGMPATMDVAAYENKQTNTSDFSSLKAVSTMTNSSKIIGQKSGDGILRKCKTSISQIQCAFCKSSADTKDTGAMTHYFNGKPVAADFNGGISVIHCHKYCAEWAPNVYFEGNLAINLSSELARSRKIKCCCCGIKGAALGCYEKSCRKSFHLTCAKQTPECRWDSESFVMLCPIHATMKLPFEDSELQRQSKKRATPKREMSDQASLTSCHGPSQTWSWPSGTCKWLICCSALSVGEKELVHKFAKLTGVPISNVWTPGVTHVIASTDENGACKRTLKTLKAILAGKWILKVDWIKSCMEFTKPVDEEKFEITVDVHGITQGPRQGRMRIMNKLPKLFNGFRFYFSGDYTDSYKGYLQDLVTTAGGTILHRKPISRDKERLLGDSHIPQTLIVYSIQPPLKHGGKDDVVLKARKDAAKALADACEATTVSNAWIIDSIAGCKLQPLVL